MAFQSGTALPEDTFNDARYNELRADTFSMPGTPNEISASRVFGTSYQNTSGYMRAVTVSFSSRESVNGGGDVRAEIHSTNFTLGTVIVARSFVASGGGWTTNHAGALTFFVPNNFYYRMRDVAGGGNSIVNWTEYEM